MAGGGSLISFPALLAVGYPSVQANVTNTVALFPGYAGSVLGGRAELAGQGGRIRSLAVTSVLGAVVGAVLLLTTPGDVFRRVVPFLILLACLLLLAAAAAQGGRCRRGPATTGWRTARCRCRSRSSSPPSTAPTSAPASA